MKHTLAEAASELSRNLELDLPPVQVSYLDAAPEGIDRHPGGVPSVCTFFAEAKDRSFYAPVGDHEACEIGAFVLGIPPKGELGDRLASTVGKMQKEGYLAPGDEAKIPHNSEAPAFVAYGRLGTLDLPPTGILLFARPKSVMLALESAGFQTPVMGRPMCSVMPTLVGGTPIALSAGCIGSRTYARIGDDRMIVGIRGDHLDTFLNDLRRVRAANESVRQEDEWRRDLAAHPYRPAPPVRSSAA
ncbi:MAG TPA: DUF169 domain-containing protein [Thermoplasmata archaeon]|nr:DUF169 domain-containing protein [Thermoplasmata archaeon]